MLNDGVILDFLEFQGEGIPGYSGGPVFNEKGELVAFMREAWFRQGVKGGPPSLFNPAFSLDFLRLTQEPVINAYFFVPGPTNSPAQTNLTSKSKISLLDVLDFPRGNLERTNQGTR
jgi:hypothetical protein